MCRRADADVSGSDLERKVIIRKDRVLRNPPNKFRLKIDNKKKVIISRSLRWELRTYDLTENSAEFQPFRGI